MKKTAIVLFVVVFVAFVFSVVARGRDYSYDDYWLNELSIVNSDELFDFQDYDCDYPECTHAAEHELSTNTLYGVSPAVERMVKKALTIPNTAGFVTTVGTFESDIKEKHTYTDKGTYLVSQGDGSFKVEDRKDTYEYETVVGTKSYETFNFYGYYCKEHEEIAKTTLRTEVTDALRTNNIYYWVNKYGFLASGILFVIATALLIWGIKREN